MDLHCEEYIHRTVTVQYHSRSTFIIANRVHFEHILHRLTLQNRDTVLRISRHQNGSFKTLKTFSYLRIREERYEWPSSKLPKLLYRIINFTSFIIGAYEPTAYCDHPTLSHKPKSKVKCKKVPQVYQREATQNFLLERPI